MTEVDLARWAFQGFFGLLVLLVVCLPREYVLRGAASEAVWRDLRLWALFLIAVHVVLYLIL